MKLLQKPVVRQISKLSQQTQLLLAAGAGMLAGATMAILAMKIDFSPAEPAAPVQQEQTAPTEADPQRRPPASFQGGVLRSMPEDSLRQK